MRLFVDGKLFSSKYQPIMVIHDEQGERFKIGEGTILSHEFFDLKAEYNEHEQRMVDDFGDCHKTVCFYPEGTTEKEKRTFSKIR